jgi:hypothetical protein
MQELTVSLKEREKCSPATLMFLELRLEHWDIDVHMVECLAKSLSGIDGLRGLYLDSNKFCCAPRLEDSGDFAVASESSPPRGKGAMYIIGVAMMVNGLKDNESLVSLKMGDFGHIIMDSTII